MSKITYCTLCVTGGFGFDKFNLCYKIKFMKVSKAAGVGLSVPGCKFETLVYAHTHTLTRVRIHTHTHTHTHTHARTHVRTHARARALYMLINEPYIS